MAVTANRIELWNPLARVLNWFFALPTTRRESSAFSNPAQPSFGPVSVSNVIMRGSVSPICVPGEGSPRLRTADYAN